MPPGFLPINLPFGSAVPHHLATSTETTLKKRFCHFLIRSNPDFVWKIRPQPRLFSGPSVERPPASVIFFPDTAQIPPSRFPFQDKILLLFHAKAD
jgi:hypothetical protein